MVTEHPTVAPSTIARAREGDRDALAEIWRTYNPQVLRFLRGLRCGEPDDVASQVWVDVARSLDRFSGDGTGLQRWIFAIAHRRNIDAGRGAARRERVRAAVEAHERADDQVPPDERALSLDAALTMLADLPTDMAEAVMLRVVWDLSVPEVAEITGKSEGNVRVLAHRGVARLRDALATADPAPGPSSGRASEGARGTTADTNGAV
ncbi:RNA polymerase sigma factor [Ilumatobacter sp.]|uniref:RNA polymerase sigma factor n=1 Tax=Ilumatobacter sp. TaxID=1967498 RepID=UPI003B51AEBA